MLGLLLRRSAGLPGVPALLTLVVLHIFGRSRPWTHEWLWSIYQFNFVTVLLGPIVAGLAAWEGLRLSRHQSLYLLSERLVLALFAAWAAVLSWVLLAFVAGLAVVLLLVKGAGTPGLPSLQELVAIAPALALLGAEGALGLAAGWRLRSPLTAPGCAVLVFLVTLFFYSRGPGQLVTVGGATDSLVGLGPRPALQISQLAFYVLFSVASIVLAAQVADPRRFNPVAAPSVIVLAALSALLVVTQGPSILERRPAALRCYGTAPEVCAGTGYARQLPAARAALIPYLDALRSTGAQVPQRFEQGREPGMVSVGPLSLGLLQGRADEAPLLLMAAYSRKDCDAKNSEVLRTQSAMLSWLIAQVSGDVPENPTLPAVLRQGSEAEQQAWVRAAVSRIQKCGG